MALGVGDVVAGYTIEDVLGAGGMGKVYRAKHPTLPRHDALKVLSAELSHDDQFRERFLREADLAATLDHPNIVAVYNRGEEDGHLWIAMQYVAGTDADKELRAQRITPQRAVHVISEVAKALDYAHSRKILHRDVKPANFLLANNDERIFLADFGIARAADEAVGLTQTGMVMASVAYAAPETLSGEGVDSRADIYALGCSLYRLLTGKAPYAGLPGGMAAVAAAHLSAPPPKVTALAPELSPAMDEVIATAMAKDPAARYRSAAELARAAEAALDGETTTDLPANRLKTVTAEWSTTPRNPGPQQASPMPPHQGFGSPPPPPQAGPPMNYPPGYDSGPNARTAPAGQYGAPPLRVNDPGPSQPSSFAPPPVATGGKKRKRGVIIGALAAVVLIVAGGTGFFLWGGGDDQRYQPQTFNHVHGSTELTAAPTAVASLGPGDSDAVLSLGVQPVVLSAPDGHLPSWEQEKAGSSATVLSFVDTAAIAAAKPDVIISTGDIDDATYERLAAIAPTITRPTDIQGDWNWRSQLQWVGRILGRSGQADGLITSVQDQQTDLKNQNSAFSGKTVQALTIGDGGAIAQVLTPSNAADYLTGLGFTYDQALRRTATDTSSQRPMPDASGVYQISTDVLVVIRTDKAAGGGGFGGLPPEFTAYRGIMVIVDDPNTIAALNDPGGYLATQFLDKSWVPDLAGQVK